MEMNIYGKVAKGEPYRKAGARLTEDAEEIQYRTKLGDPAQQKREFKIYHMFDKAHLVMLAEQKIIDRADSAKMLRALRRMESLGLDTIRAETQAGEHSGEAWLISELGEQTGGKIHAGRSSGDFMAVTGRIFTRDYILTLMEASLDLRSALIRLAENNIDTVMAAVTWSQHAQPNSFAHHVMSWEYPLENDFTRLKQMYGRINCSPAGAGILTGSRYPIDRERTAALLGFDSVIPNTRYAVLGFDGWLGVSPEAYMVPTVLMVNVSGIAADLYTWGMTEFKYIELADRYCGTSSIMPQKKNPYTLLWIRGAASRTYGRLAAFLYEMHDVCAGFTRQLAETLDDIKEAVTTMTGVLTSIKVNKERMKHNAITLDWCCATDIADLLVLEKGLPFRTAHQIVAILVRKSIEKGITQAEVTSEMVDEVAVEYLGKRLEISQSLVDSAINPAECIAARKLLGGPAPERINQDISRAGDQITKDRQEVSSLRERLRVADSALEKAIDAILTTG